MNSKIMLEGKYIYLQPFCEHHISPEYVSWLNNSQVTQYSNQRFLHHTSETCLKYFRSFENSPNKFWAIHTKEGKHIGTLTNYISVHHHTADMGIMIGDPESWGKGLGFDAWKTSMNSLFKSGIRKVTAGTLACNMGMLSIMKKAGMIYEGKRIRQEIVNNQEIDILYYAKFRTE